MKNIKTQGIILKAINYGDYDQILTVLSRDLGKIKVMARGVRRPKSKIRGGCQIFSFVQMELYQGNQMYRLIQSASLKSFIQFREDYDRLLAASQWAEVLEQTSLEGEGDESLFSLALSGFTWLAFGEAEKILPIFLAKLLSCLGVLSGKPECVASTLDPQARKILHFFLEEDLETAMRLQVTPVAMNHITRFLQEQLECHMGKELKIFRHIQEVIDRKQ